MRLGRRAVRILLDRGLLRPRDVHVYGVTARDVSESNGVSLVELGNGTGFAVKDLSEPGDAVQGHPEREVALYRRFSSDPRVTGLLPRLCLHDPQEQLLVLEGLVSARRMDRMTSPSEPTNAGLARVFGETLGRWHGSAPPLPRTGERELPWVVRIGAADRLRVIEEDPRLRSLADAVLADPSHRQALARVADIWRVDATVHGDVRFSNILVRTSSPCTVVLVDWESSGPGDSYWDVAGGVQEYLCAGIGWRAAAVPGPSGPVESFLAGYAQGRGAMVEAARLRPFVASRLLMRAFQLTNWMQESEDEVARHRAIARRVMEGNHHERA